MPPLLRYNSSSDIVGKVIARWWAIGWLIRGLPLIAAGWLFVGPISRFWISIKYRLAFRLLAGSIIFSLVGAIIRPYVGFIQITATADPPGANVTVVSTGILPIRISSNNATLDLVAGQVGTITGIPGPGGSGVQLVLAPHMSWQWWLVCLVLAATPIIWVLIVGAPPLDQQPPPQARRSRPFPPFRLLSGHKQRRGWAAATALIMLTTAGSCTDSTNSAFAAESLNSNNTVGSNTYFTCTEAEPGIAPGHAYYIWPMAETDTASPAQDISGNNRAGTYSGDVTPDPQARPCARDAGGSMTFGINGTTLSNAPITTAPNTFTESIWFHTTLGGRLIGWGNSSTGTSTVYDRQIWIDNAGHVIFGVHNTTYHQAISPLSYNDNNWHQAAASLSPAGMALYVDGALVATNAATNAATTGSSFINLGSASTFAVIGSTVTSSGNTVLNGDLGVTAATTAVGFPPGVVNGHTHLDDAAAAQAKTDTQAAYNQVAALTPTGSFAGDQNGITFSPGVYHTSSAFALTGTMTLDAHGDPNAHFVFQTDAALNTTAGSHVVLANGAQSSNVYWQAVGAVGTGANSTMVGTILGNAALTLGSGSTLNGRALAVDASTLDNNTVDLPTSPGTDSGYFRVGYDNMTDVPNPPSNSSFTGDLGFAAVYLTALTAAQIRTAYIAGT